MMPRDDIKALIARTALLTFEHNGTSTLDGDAVLKIIDAMYDDYESELKLASDVYSTDKMHLYQELKELNNKEAEYVEKIKELEEQNEILLEKILNIKD